MASKKPQLKTYTTKEIIEKFNHIADAENRSVSKQLEYIVKKEIQKYEKEHGEIDIKQ